MKTRTVIMDYEVVKCSLCFASLLSLRQIQAKIKSCFTLPFASHEIRYSGVSRDFSALFTQKPPVDIQIKVALLSRKYDLTGLIWRFSSFFGRFQ